MTIDWHEVACDKGMQPWRAEHEELELYVQPYYGDGIWWKGIIKHLMWTLTLSKRFSDMSSATVEVEHMAKKMLSLK